MNEIIDVVENTDCADLGELTRMLLEATQKENKKLRERIDELEDELEQTKSMLEDYRQGLVDD